MEGEKPEALEAVWDKDVAETFGTLPPKQQQFLIEYLKCWNGSAAYRKAYNPKASIAVASANGSRLIANDKVSAILAKFAERRTEALLTVSKTYFEMTAATLPKSRKAPDWKARKDGADGLARVYGLNAAEEKKVTGSITVKSSPLDEAL